MAAVTDIGAGVVTLIADLRAIASEVYAVRHIARSGRLAREDVIALERRCKAIDAILQRYLQLRLPFSPYCPTCGADVSKRRY